MSQMLGAQRSWISPTHWHGAVRVMSTTRFGGVSPAPFDTLNVGMHVGDSAQAVAQNRQLLRVGLPVEPLWLNQVHGCRVLDADHIEPGERFEADAALTSSGEVVLAIQTADCMPVVIHAEGQVLGVAHAGWRGLAQGVLSALVDAMQHKLGAHGSRSQWHAWIGPCIGQQSFQVGDDVRQAFVEKRPCNSVHFNADLIAPHKWLCDLPGLALSELKILGIEQSQWCGLCTVTDKQARFFSYRRDGRTGRMATLAWLNTNSLADKN